MLDKLEKEQAEHKINQTMDYLNLAEETDDDDELKMDSYEKALGYISLAKEHLEVLKLCLGIIKGDSSG